MRGATEAFMDGRSEPALAAHTELREFRQFARRMMTFWTVIFPGAFLSSQLIESLRSGSWVLVGIFGTMWFVIGVFCWQIRRAFVLLLDTQDLRDEVGYAELLERKARADRHVDRLTRAQTRLARIRHEQEMRSRDETVEDLAALAEERGEPTKLEP